MLKLTTDKQLHDASRGLSATAELLVGLFVYIVNHCVLSVLF